MTVQGHGKAPGKRELLAVSLKDMDMTGMYAEVRAAVE